MTSEAIILAGGLGTRLREAVSDVPKPLAPVAGRPFLEFLLRNYHKQGINRFVLSIGYKGEMIEEFCRKTFPDWDIVFCREDEPLGTGGALKKACGLVNGDSVLVSNGDSYLNVDLKTLSKLYDSKNADLVMAVTKINQNANRYGGIELLSSGKIKSFSAAGKEDTTQKLINGGVYLIKSLLLEKLPSPNQFSLEKDFLEVNLKKLSIWGHECPSSDFIDIGLPEDYKRAQKMKTFQGI
jgi:D-glycero-alpha-D-manno-heptose 1-phosphate guanylyltransferase